MSKDQSAFGAGEPGEAPKQSPPGQMNRTQTRFRLFVSLVQDGHSVREAATKSGLSADQVLHWLEDDATVVAALESTRSLIEAQIRFRLLALAHKAVDAIDQALEDGNADVAIRVLDSLELTGTNQRDRPSPDAPPAEEASSIE